jgi:hypothetical protein
MLYTSTRAQVRLCERKSVASFLLRVDQEFRWSIVCVRMYVCTYVRMYITSACMLQLFKLLNVSAT